MDMEDCHIDLYIWENFFWVEQLLVLGFQLINFSRSVVIIIIEITWRYGKAKSYQQPLCLMIFIIIIIIYQQPLFLMIFIIIIIILPAALVLAPPHLLQIATKVTWMKIINTERMKLEGVAVNFKASFLSCMIKLTHVLR